jgi:hypothetical protein
MEEGDASSRSRRSQTLEPPGLRGGCTSRDASYYSSRTSTVIVDTAGLWTTSVAAKELGGLLRGEWWRSAVATLGVKAERQICFLEASAHELPRKESPVTWHLVGAPEGVGRARPRPGSHGQGALDGAPVGSGLQVCEPLGTQTRHPVGAH